MIIREPERTNRDAALERPVVAFSNKGLCESRRFDALKLPPASLVRSQKERARREISNDAGIRTMPDGEPMDRRKLAVGVQAHHANHLPISPDGVALAELSVSRSIWIGNAKYVPQTGLQNASLRRAGRHGKP